MDAREVNVACQRKRHPALREPVFRCRVGEWRYLPAGLVAEIACSEPDFLALEARVLELLDHHIGADTAFFIGNGGPTRNSRGVITTLGVELERVWPQLANTSGARALVSAARAQRGVVIDSELFGAALRRQAYYQRLMAPLGGTTTLFTVLPHQHPAKTELVLGRCEGSPPFTKRDKALVASLVPTLSLAFLAHQRRIVETQRVAPLCPLTAREREVSSYLRLGYTNQQIGLALGTAERTVRNQLSRIYEKLGVASRAEAVAVLSHDTPLSV